MLTGTLKRICFCQVEEHEAEEETKTIHCRLPQTLHQTRLCSLTQKLICADVRALKKHLQKNASLIGLIDLGVTGPKVVVISELPAGVWSDAEL